MTGDRAAGFAALYDEHFTALLGYALRRVAVAEDAADVVSETFLVAWRRLPDVPDGAEGRLWLYGVARRVLANHRRGEGRRDRLGDALRQRLAQTAPDHADEVVGTERVRAALRRLSPEDRELVTLTVWEGLEPREVARVLGVRPGAVRTRLSRARGRLRALVGDEDGGPGHVPGDSPTPAREGR